MIGIKQQPYQLQNWWTQADNEKFVKKAKTNFYNCQHKFRVHLNQTQQLMSLFCESSPELPDSSLEEFSLNIFSTFINANDGLRVSTNEFVLKLQNHQDKIAEGITSWMCTQTSTQITIRVTLQLIKPKKTIQKRLADTLNKQFKLSKLTYLRPKLTSIHKLHAHPSSKSLQQQLTSILQYLAQVITRIKQLEKQHSKLQPYLELYVMRECFQFSRSSRPKSSKISLKAKKNKVVTEVMRLLAQGEVTINKLEGVFVEGQIKKYEEHKTKVMMALEEMAKNGDKTLEQSILTSIDIMKVQNQTPLAFANPAAQTQLSVLTKGLYTLRKQITIHKQSKIQSLSNEVFEQCLIKKSKSPTCAGQFDNQTRLLAFLKGSYHPHIAEYYCKLQETPFKSQAVYVRHYESGLGALKGVISIDKLMEVTHQISKVLTYLAYRRICHRDLKLDNIMLDSSLGARVIDWGSACQMFTLDKDGGGLKVKNQQLYSTQGYFQRYFEDVCYEPFGKHYTRQQIEKGEFFDVYSFGLIIEKLFSLKQLQVCSWVQDQMQYLSKKCREKNPADRLSAIEFDTEMEEVPKIWSFFANLFS